MPSANRMEILSKSGERSGALEAVDVDYYVGRDNKIILHLHHPCKFVIIGCLRVTVLQGKVTIFGYDLSAESPKKSVTIFAHEGSAKYKIKSQKPRPEASVTAAFIFGPVMRGVLDEAQMEQLYTHVKVIDSIIQVVEVELPFSKALDYMLPTDLPVTAETSTFHEIKCAIACPPVYLDDGVNNWSEVDPGQVTITMSPGGMGKSKFTNFLTNRLLNENGKVLYLDLDLGQNEFAPPGSVAAIMLDEPILGINYSSTRTLLKMVHVGEPTSENCLPRFLEAVRILVDFADRENLRDIPWMVNTLALYKGAGLEAAKETIAIVRPTTVIGLTHVDCDNQLVDQLTPSSNQYEYFTVQNSNRPTLNNTHENWKQAKYYFRGRMLISYLSPVLSPPHYLFNNAQHHRLPLSSVVLGVNSMESEGALRKRFTHALVALLCQLPHDPSTAVGCLQVSLHLPMQPAIGLGVVMAMELRELHLLTPVPAWEMGMVKVLQLSGVQAPQHMFMSHAALDNAKTKGTQKEVFQRLNHKFAKGRRQPASHERAVVQGPHRPRRSQ